MLRSSRPLLGATLVATSCASAPFSLVYCEDADLRPTHCDCTRSTREVVGDRVGEVEVREHDADGTPRRRHREGRDLPFVLRGRWLVLRVPSANRRPTSLQAWLDCDDAVIPAAIAQRSIEGEGPLFEHEFLALFPATPSLPGAAECRLHVTIVDAGGWILTRMTTPVHVVDRALRPVAGLPWGVPIGDGATADPDKLEPRPLAPLPRLCRTDD